MTADSDLTLSVVVPATDAPPDLGPCTADFRDQYYGLVPFVREAASGVLGPGEVALATTGLIEPAECRWGRTPTRFAKQRYVAPVVDLATMYMSAVSRLAILLEDTIARLDALEA